MGMPAIQVEGLGKRYTLGESITNDSTLYDNLASIIARKPRAKRGTQEMWALRDLDFHIQQGEVTALIGRNGAGKSTLLKILSRITSPTTGRALVRGKLASLLEVGTGFHPELTGRENIYLNGSILGMRRHEVRRHFDEIVAFAEISAFIDTPVKRYSSGMYVRLAFAVAAHLDPDILIIDEVLAVGDAAFQEKCLGKMSAIGRSGVTVLVVSHNIANIQKLCGRALLIEGGRLACEGTVDEVCTRYMAAAFGRGTSWVPTVAQPGPFQYTRVFLRPAASNELDLCLQFTVRLPVSGRLSLLLKNQYGVVVCTSSDTDSEPYMQKRWEVGSYEETCRLPVCYLAPGRYSISISRPVENGNELLEDVCAFSVDVGDTLAARDGREGIIMPTLEWQIGSIA